MSFRRMLPAVLLAAASCKSEPAKIATAAGVPVKEIAVTTRGFEPSRVEVDAGKPVVLRFTRKVAETCGDAVDVQGDPVRHMLPLNKPIDVQIVAPASGQIAFACPMKMYRGAAVATGR